MMAKTPWSWASGVVFLCGHLGLSACSTVTEPAEGTGGTAPVAESGGASGTTGGASSSGGSSATGGSVSGGATSAGGTTSTGGTTFEPEPPYCEGKDLTAVPLVVTDEFVASGYMGDHADVVMTEDACEARAEGAAGTCFSVVYEPEGAMGWAGVAFQYPLDNWGTVPGLCIDTASKVVFKAKGAAGGEEVTFGAAGQDGEVETLTAEWADYEVSLPSNYAESGDSGGVASGFTWTAASAQGEITFYLDDIRWVAD